MLGVYYIEERLKILTKQGKVSFHASTCGHEKLQVGIVMLMRPGHDWFFPYYREGGKALHQRTLYQELLPVHPK